MDLQISVLSFNHPVITSRCIKSCLKHIKASSIELVHNGSDKKFVNQLQQEFPKVSHLILEKNKGFTGGTNKALESSLNKASWCLFITNDCELLQIPRSFSGFQSGCYAPLIFRRNTGKVDSFGGLVNTEKGSLKHIQSPKQNLISNEPFYIPGTAFLISKQAYLKTTPFDESLGTYWEDVDFSLNCQKNKVPLFQTDLIQLKHAVGKTCHKKTYYTNYLYQRNRIRVCRKWKWGSEYHFFKDTLVHCSIKAKRGQWPEAWRRAKAYFEA